MEQVAEKPMQLLIVDLLDANDPVITSLRNIQKLLSIHYLKDHLLLALIIWHNS